MKFSSFCIAEGLKFKGRVRSVKPKSKDNYRTIHYGGQQHIMKKTNTGWEKIKEKDKSSSNILHKNKKGLGSLFGLDMA